MNNGDSFLTGEAAHQAALRHVGRMGAEWFLSSDCGERNAPNEIAFRAQNQPPRREPDRRIITVTMSAAGLTAKETIDRQ